MKCVSWCNKISANALSVFLCCLLLQRSSTCGDIDADGTAGPTYSQCDTGFEYDAIKADNVVDATGKGDCCKVCFGLASPMGTPESASHGDNSQMHVAPQLCEYGCVPGHVWLQKHGHIDIVRLTFRLLGSLQEIPGI